MRKRSDSVCGWGGTHLDQMLWQSRKNLKKSYIAHLKAIGMKGISSNVVGFDGQQRIYVPNRTQTCILLSSVSSQLVSVFLGRWQMAAQIVTSQ